MRDVDTVAVPLRREAGEADDVGEPGGGGEHLVAVAPDQQRGRVGDLQPVAGDPVVLAVEADLLTGEEPTRDLGRFRHARHGTAPGRT